MPFLLVLGLSLLVGGAVYLATVRSEHEASGLGFGHDRDQPSEKGAAPAAGPGYAYLRVSTEGPSIQDRLQGFIGVVVLVGIGAVVLAFAIYQAGHLVDQLFKSFFGA